MKSEEEDRMKAFSDEDPVSIPIDGILDLHTFAPSEVHDLINDYIAECLKRNIFDLRIIHGKGKGILLNKVRSILAKNPNVASFKEAPLEAGGWGATIVQLRETFSEPDEK